LFSVAATIPKETSDDNYVLESDSESEECSAAKDECSAAKDEWHADNCTKCLPKEATAELTEWFFQHRLVSRHSNAKLQLILGIVN
jgi:hypothetical protein